MYNLPIFKAYTSSDDLNDVCVISALFGKDYLVDYFLGPPHPVTVDKESIQF